MHPLPVHISMIVESFSLLSSIILLTIFINPSVSTRGIKTLLSTYNIKDTKEASFTTYSKGSPFFNLLNN